MGAEWDKGDEHYLLCFVSFTLKKHEIRLTKQNLYRCENPRAIQFLSFYVFCIPEHFKKKTPYACYFSSPPLVFFFFFPFLCFMVPDWEKNRRVGVLIPTGV